jgi:hypothetical protein
MGMILFDLQTVAFLVLKSARGIADIQICAQTDGHPLPLALGTGMESILTVQVPRRLKFSGSRIGATRKKPIP